VVDETVDRNPPPSSPQIRVDVEGGHVAWPTASSNPGI
jgi:hypothetical protein